MAQTTTSSAIPAGTVGRTDSARSLTLRTTIGTLIAVVFALGLRWIAVSTNPELAALGPFAPLPIVVSVIVAGVGAALVYTVGVRYATRPVRTFLLAAGGVFVAMLLPVLLVAPTLGVGTIGQLWLVGLHLAVALPLVTAIVRIGLFTVDPAGSESPSREDENL